MTDDEDDNINLHICQACGYETDGPAHISMRGDGLYVCSSCLRPRRPEIVQDCHGAEYEITHATVSSLVEQRDRLTAALIDLHENLLAASVQNHPHCKIADMAAKVRLIIYPNAK